MIHPLWYICIAIRLLLAFAIGGYMGRTNSTIHTLIRAVLLVVGLGFAYKAVTGSNDEIQVTKVFWHNTRFAHSALYIGASATPHIKQSALLLVADCLGSIIYRAYLELIV